MNLYLSVEDVWRPMAPKQRGASYSLEVLERGVINCNQVD